MAGVAFSSLHLCLLAPLRFKEFNAKSRRCKEAKRTVKGPPAMGLGKDEITQFIFLSQIFLSAFLPR